MSGELLLFICGPSVDMFRIFSNPQTSEILSSISSGRLGRPDGEQTGLGLGPVWNS